MYLVRWRLRRLKSKISSLKKKKSHQMILSQQIQNTRRCLIAYFKQSLTMYLKWVWTLFLRMNRTLFMTKRLIFSLNNLQSESETFQHSPILILLKGSFKELNPMIATLHNILKLSSNWRYQQVLK